MNIDGIKEGGGTSKKDMVGMMLKKIQKVLFGPEKNGKRKSKGYWLSQVHLMAGKMECI